MWKTRFKLLAVYVASAVRTLQGALRLRSAGYFAAFAGPFSRSYGYGLSLEAR